MTVAVHEKFRQNINLREKLWKTGNNKLVEASRDVFLGAGVPLTSVNLMTNT